ALFAASGYVEEARLTDYVGVPSQGGAGGTGFLIPVATDDLAAMGLLGEGQPPVCWERSVETLTARKDDIAGLAIASEERIECYIIYVERGSKWAEILSLLSLVDDSGERQHQLLAQLGTRGVET